MVDEWILWVLVYQDRTSVGPQVAPELCAAVTDMAATTSGTMEAKLGATDTRLPTAACSLRGTPQHDAILSSRICLAAIHGASVILRRQQPVRLVRFTRGPPISQTISIHHPKQPMTTAVCLFACGEFVIRGKCQNMDSRNSSATSSIIQTMPTAVMLAHWSLHVTTRGGSILDSLVTNSRVTQRLQLCTSATATASRFTSAHAFALLAHLVRKAV